MSNTRTNVTTGKPKIGGAVSVAPEGTDLPNDATTALAAAYKGLGYCSEDGVSNSKDISSENIKAWGGDIVLVTQTDTTDTFTVTLIEAMNADVLKAVYGDENVSGTSLEVGLTVKSTSEQATAHVWVFDMILNTGAVKRIVLPAATVTAIDTITYNDSEAVGYGLTLTAAADDTGTTHYEYIKAGSTASQEASIDSREE